MKFKDKVAVITGGSGILCSAMAKSLAEEGCKVAILGSRIEKVDKVVNEIKSLGHIAYGYACDILDKEALIKGKELINLNLGQVDILINGAGGNNKQGNTTFEEYTELDPHSFFDIEKHGIEQVFGVNFTGTFLATQVFASDMVKKKNGTIINIGSMSGITPLTKIPVYSASKSAISNFTSWLAVYFASTGIRVNAISPGFFLTDQNYSLMIDENGNYTERAKKILVHTPMKRLGVAEDLLGALKWLANDKESGFVTGIVLPIDGGFSSYSGV